ncbi:type II/IV secretion system ATPase subunit [Candidatus Woesearchaeota archaeon]|nr:type II/IV secretion system ATPase subunit [Candidatus Woesearchaeota archaeon]
MVTKKRGASSTRKSKVVSHKVVKKSHVSKKETISKNSDLIDDYSFTSNEIPVRITIERKKGEFVPIYSVKISKISQTTAAVLENIRKELIKQVNLGIVDIQDAKRSSVVSAQFQATISILLDKYFPDIEAVDKNFLNTYLVQESLGMGSIEILMNDASLEEIAINGSYEPVWVYHKSHGWLKTDITVTDEEQIKHYATMIGRKVGRQLSVLEPLLDAHINAGDRANATISPISSRGNTITLRKFSRDPWTITKFIESKTMSLESASLIWLSMHYELSALIAGGTASGKTSALNVLANFFPPNQRIISIEDTREIKLPKFLHWVPMTTRTPNAEGKGEISMEDLLVNALRQRPDRILVGEVRRKREAETLFEAIHTGHSCYATFHANNAEEAIKRLTNKPIEVPKTMVNAISLMIIQFRNRRTGLRRTFQLAELDDEGDANVLMQYDAKRDILSNKYKSKRLFHTLELYTGSSLTQLNKMMKEKQDVLRYLVKNKIYSVDGVGRVMAEYYTNTDELMKNVHSNKLFFDPKNIDLEIKKAAEESKTQDEPNIQAVRK